MPETDLCTGHLLEAWAVMQRHRYACAGSPPDPQAAGTYPHSLVYYLRLPTGRIAIGHTTNLPARLPTFGLSLADVLAVEPGGLSWELSRHEEFADTRVSLLIEEFEPGPALRAHIDSVRTAWGQPAPIATALAEANHQLRSVRAGRRAG